jgi:hypothetical protein
MSRNGAKVERTGTRATVKVRQRQLRRMRPTLVALEDRRLLSTFVVNNPTDTPVAGETDLRQAIASANATTGANTITFDSTVFATPQTITLGGTQLELSNTSGTQTITGPSAGVTVSGGGLSRVFQFDANVTASISQMTITGGSALDGGGLYNLGTATLTDCLVVGNSSGNAGSSGSNGGGIHNDGTLTLSDCTVSGNFAIVGAGLDNYGALILTNCTVDSNTGSYGGGVFAGYGGTTTLSNCTISGNSTTGPRSDGGGVTEGSGGTLTLINCTLSGNSAGANGGGLDNYLGSVTADGCTISGNTSAKYGGGLDNYGGTVTLGNTIDAGNTATAGGPDASGAFTSRGNNLIGETDGSSGWVGSDLTGTVASPLDPLLAPLAYNGGPTQTMALLPGSPAIGAGTSTGITTDQRGFPLEGPIDIGAFQVQSGPLVVNTTAGGPGSPLGTLDLPAAVNLADALPGQNTITFDPTVFATPQTITLTGSQLELSNTSGTQTITGPAAGVTVSGGGLSRVFQVDSGVTATLSGLTISGGYTPGLGGGLYDDGGTATLTDVTVSGNSAFEGGGLYSLGGSATLALTNCTVSGNSAGDEGAGLFSRDGTATLASTKVSGNSASFSGGGLYLEQGTSTLTDCIVADNVVTEFNGGGLENSSGTTTLINTIVSGNSANYGAGVWSDATTTLINCTATGNSAGINGGGLYNGYLAGLTTLTNCTVSGNFAGHEGGGLYSGISGSTTTLNNTIVAGNTNSSGANDIVSSGTDSGSHNLIGTGGSGGAGERGRRQHRRRGQPGARPTGRLRRTDPDDGLAPRKPRDRRGEQLHPRRYYSDHRPARGTAWTGRAQRRTDRRHRRLRGQFVVPGHKQRRHSGCRHAQRRGRLGQRQHQRQPGQSRQPRAQHGCLRHRGCLRHAADDHPHGHRARALEHEHGGDDHRPGGGIDGQWRRALPGVPGR